MITLILCLRPLRVPKFIWFKILHSRRYEFGPEMSAGDDPDDIIEGAYAARNAGLINHAFPFSQVQRFWMRIFCINNEIEILQKCESTVMYWNGAINEAYEFGHLELIKFLEPHLCFIENIEDKMRNAIYRYRKDIVKHLLQYDIDADHFVEYAEIYGFDKIVQILLPYCRRTRGFAKVNFNEFDNTRRVCRKGQIEKLPDNKLIWHYGVDAAYQYGQVELIKHIAPYVGQIKRIKRKLHGAVISHNVELVKYMLETFEIDTTRHIIKAICLGHFEILKLLLPHGSKSHILYIFYAQKAENPFVLRYIQNLK